MAALLLLGRFYIHSKKCIRRNYKATETIEKLKYAVADLHLWLAIVKH